MNDVTIKVWKGTRVGQAVSTHTLRKLSRSTHDGQTRQANSQVNLLYCPYLNEGLAMKQANYLLLVHGSAI